MTSETTDKVMPEDVLDQLYASSPDDFVRLRNEQAGKLKAAGKDAAAREVKGLSRPTVAAWALNQLAREKSEQVSKLLAAGQELERAHRRMLSGVDAHGLQEAVKKRRALLHELEGEAAKILEKSGRSPDSHRAAIAATLQTASSERDAAELLQKGRFTRELPPPSGFGNLTGLNLVAKPEQGARKAARQEAAREVRTAEAPVDLAAERKKREQRTQQSSEDARDDNAAKGSRRTKTKSGEDKRRQKKRAGAERAAAERAARELAEAKRALTLAEQGYTATTRTAKVTERRAESARKRADRAADDAERIAARAQRAQELAAKLAEEADLLGTEAEEASEAALRAEEAKKKAEANLKSLSSRTSPRGG